MAPILDVLVLLSIQKTLHCKQSKNGPCGLPVQKQQSVWNTRATIIRKLLNCHTSLVGLNPRFKISEWGTLETHSRIELETSEKPTVFNLKNLLIL